MRWRERLKWIVGVFFSFGGLEVKWDIEKKQVCSENINEKKWESGIEIFNERGIKSERHPREGWAKWRVGEVARRRNWDEVWEVRDWTVYQDPSLANPEEKETRLSSCLSFSTSLWTPVPESFQFFLVHTSCSQESLGFYSPFKTSFKSNTKSEQVRSCILRKKTFWLWCNFSSLRPQPLRRFTAKCCCLGAAAKVLPNSSDHIYYLAARSCELQFGAFIDSCGEAFRWMALVCVIYLQAVCGHPPAEGLGADLWQQIFTLSDVLCNPEGGYLMTSHTGVLALWCRNSEKRAPEWYSCLCLVNKRRLIVACEG